MAVKRATQDEERGLQVNMPQAEEYPVAGNYGVKLQDQVGQATSDSSSTPGTFPLVGHHRLDPELAALRVLINSPAGIVHSEATGVESRDFSYPCCGQIYSAWHALAVEQTRAGHGTAEVNPSLVYDALTRAGHTQALHKLPIVVAHGDEPPVSRHQVPKTVEALIYARLRRAADTTGNQLQQAASNGSHEELEQAMRLIPFLVQAADRAGIATGEVA